MAVLRSFDLGTLCGRNGWQLIRQFAGKVNLFLLQCNMKDLTHQIVNPVAGRVFL